MKKRTPLLGLGVITVLVILLFVPFDMQVAPQRHFRIVNSEGDPLPGTHVRQVCDQYALGKTWEIEVYADENGLVSLDSQSLRTSIFELLKGGLRQIIEIGINFSFWSNDDILVIARGYPLHMYPGGKGLKSGKAVLRKGPLDKTIIGSGES